MFSLKNKLDKNLKIALDNKNYKEYRVIIHCKTMFQNVENKLKGYKCPIFCLIPSINCICASVSPNVLEKLTELPQVDYITFDSFAYLCGRSVLASNGVLCKNKYNLSGKGVCVGVIDTGVYPHPDMLSPHNKIKKFVDLINNYTYPYDDNGHGTFVSGLICGSGSSSKNQYIGVAESSSIYSIKAFNKFGQSFVSHILYSLQILITESTEFNIKVICLPFELKENDYFILSLFSNLFKQAINKGIVVVVPAGHNGNNECSIRGIATLNTCITVGGIDTTRGINVFPYSSSGPFNNKEKPDVAAGCVDICSLNCNVNYIPERNGMKLYPKPLEELYTCYSGTSCAAAYVSGLCALLFENNPALSFKDVLSLLKISCSLADMPKFLQGAGVINFEKLLP